jgi:sulfite exporter TauE/SafE
VTELWPVLTAAFITGFLGSAHCFGMCGGISGLFAVNASIVSLRSQFPKAIAYNTGRILSYAFLGIVVAMLGKTAVDSIPDLMAPVRLASGLLIVLVGLQLAFGWRILAPLENAGARLWKRIAPAAKGLVPVNTMPQAFGLGLIWGWLPCGLVYSVLVWSVSTGDPLYGAALLFSFGLGTLPNLMLMGAAAAGLSARVRDPRTRRLAGFLVLLFGLYSVFKLIR